MKSVTTEQQIERLKFFGKMAAIPFAGAVYFWQRAERNGILSVKQAKADNLRGWALAVAEVGALAGAFAIALIPQLREEAMWLLPTEYLLSGLAIGWLGTVLDAPRTDHKR